MGKKKPDILYNIVEYRIHFAGAPFGKNPIGSITNPPDSRDFTGITTSSSFQGRTFLRNAAQRSTSETYADNYIFDDISRDFTVKVVTSLSSSSDKNNHQKKPTIRIDMPNKYSLLDFCPSDEGGADLSIFKLLSKSSLSLI